MVLVDSRNIPYGEIITVPMQAHEITASMRGPGYKSSLQTIGGGARLHGNSKSVIQTKVGPAAKALVNRNLQHRGAPNDSSRSKNLVKNFVSKAYGQSMLGVQGLAKSVGQRSQMSSVSTRPK